jgi:hypothetical protein
MLRATQAASAARIGGWDCNKSGEMPCQEADWRTRNKKRTCRDSLHPLDHSYVMLACDDADWPLNVVVLGSLELA